ncbi:endopeptidase La [Taklimakanibacter albus]|uniref:Endopeptidase La n=1 Tax=Taklimakanibacter albus TaxID=2800327 RepID=A0ACC5QXM1_9HYPH|nr:endopeptidase La [Aestuariivirga sp. YIM B02566]MBK1864938.1 endopeptidase La [Aestuariivirga sp. YIM B02566]
MPDTVSQPNQARKPEAFPPLPDDALAILPARQAVLFPGIVLPLTLNRPASIAAAQEAVRHERNIAVLLQRDPSVDEPMEEQLYRVGTAAEILRYVTAPDGTHHLICRGVRRIRIMDYLSGYPFLAARVEQIGTSEVFTPAIEARVTLLKQRAQEALQLLPNFPAEMGAAIEGLDSPSALADFVAGVSDAKPAEKQEILEAVDVTERLDKVLAMIGERLKVLRLTKEIGDQTQSSLSSQQRQHILREQLRQIQKELGEGDEKSAEIAELGERIAKAEMPKEAKEQADKELKRLERMPEAAGEYAMIRTYLDWLIDLPWSKLAPERIDIAEARRILDEEHFGLEKVKRRILEFLAVRKLNPDGKSPILCFIGPPGVGKTSLGQSIAHATGRKFARISLGGVHDEAEIRGHRRTYIGALPGNIIQAMRRAEIRNPVLMLDEMDKLGSGFQGDPSSALLEVLDPEQNSTFRDNYLAVPFDLSKVMFIGTANMADTIPGPVRDRMEIIEIPSYIDEEKLEIAKRYLVKRQLAAAGLDALQCEITDAALSRIIRDYTREAGVRNLEREIGAVCRHAAMRIAEKQDEKLRVTEDNLTSILGPPRFERESAMRTSVPGVATGLAWTPVGGDILFIEATRTPGNGRLVLTGQLGDVMKESAQAALTLAKGRTAELGVASDSFEKSDIHIHVPAGAIPKDGPSAGVAMFTALASLLTGRTVRSDTAMTGEISLRGLVLPIGGVKEKVLAAIRAGITTVLLPARNRKDLEDVPESARQHVRIVWLDTVEDAVAAALEAPGAASLASDATPDSDSQRRAARPNDLP